jgi:hypothetical protein
VQWDFFYSFLSLITAVAQVERGLPSLSESKISEIAKIYGIKSIESNKVVFYPEMLHICYIPVSYRIVQWDFFYSFLSLITAVEMVFFAKQKHLVAIAIKDIHNCIFLFLPRSGEKLGKTGIIENIIEKTGIKKSLTKTVELKEGLKNISKNELEQYFSSVYCYTCPRIVATLPDGRTLLIPVVPIGAILEDLYHYLHYETNPVRKEYTFLDLFKWLQKILQKSDSEITQDLEKARKIWNF